MTNRIVIEAPISQGSYEEVVYSVTIPASWGVPTSPVVVAYDVSQEPPSAVTGTLFPVNTPTVNAQIITLSPCKSLTRGRRYQVLVRFNAGGNKLEAVIPITGEL